MKKYHAYLFIAFLVVWVWAAYEPAQFDTWLLENLLVFVFVPLIFFAGRYFRLSKVSYTLLTVFMILHVIGSHYTYSGVPFGETLKDWIGAERNMYDRLVHFSFGFLLAYPIREVFMRLAQVRGIWSYYLPLDVVLSFSAVYEIIEWLTAIMANPSAGIEFLGTQGDVWDAQKDMLMAGTGALLAMLIIAIINWRLNRNFGTEMKESFKISSADSHLGEVALEKYLKETE